MIPLDTTQFHEISAIAQQEAGLHLPEAKRNFAMSRLQRRLRETGYANFAPYVRLIKEVTEAGAQERARMISALTTNVTDLFREGHHFKYLHAWLLTQSSRHPSRRFVFWSAGCSSGEEPLSIAAVCAAALGRNWSQTVSILATDIDEVALQRCRETFQSPASLQRLRERFALTLDSDCGDVGHLAQNATEKIALMRHNLLEPLPARLTFDVIFCRNVIIYFDSGSQETAQRLLLERLSGDGVLFFGHSERLLIEEQSFSLVAPTTYERTDVPQNEVAKWD